MLVQQGQALLNVYLHHFSMFLEKKNAAVSSKTRVNSATHLRLHVRHTFMIDIKLKNYVINIVQFVFKTV